MLIAAVDSTGYKIMFLLHLVAAVAAFGPLFLYPALRKAGQTQTIAGLHLRMVFPAMVLLWVFGMGLAGMSDSEYELSQTWLVLAVLVWVVVIAVNWFLVLPALADPGDAATSKLMAGVGVTHLGLIVGMILMIWKPGL